VTDAEQPDDRAVELVVSPDDRGVRLDSFVASSLPNLSRARAQRAIDEGDVLVDGAPAKSGLKLRGGEIVEVDVPEPLGTDLVPEAIALDVVYEDAALLVVNKPAGLVVHPGAGVRTGTLANGLVFRFGATGGGPAWRPGIVHRIDKGTSGLLVVARTEAAHADLSAQFAARTVTKSYLALVFGALDDRADIDLPIGRDPKVRVRMAVARPGRGREAQTSYRVLERFEHASLLDVAIHTGRTHQIRVHLGHIGYPVVGDEVYGKGRIRQVRDVGMRKLLEQLDRPFLHAARLAFDHPTTHERMDFSCPLPRQLEAVLEACRERARRSHPRAPSTLPAESS
jgi:23S rRNA pseudouridine1911/1915/1917 synthase